MFYHGARQNAIFRASLRAPAKSRIMPHMHRFHYHIRAMDCPSEETLIREQLADMADIAALHFDLGKRELQVFSRSDNVAEVSARLAALQLGSALLGTSREDAPALPVGNPQQERRVLRIVLAINAVFFVAESLFGWLAGSMGLMADALDMLADSLVYALSLLAVGATLAFKRRVAGIAGWLQTGLAVLGLLEVLRRVFAATPPPDVATMISLSLLALLGNAACLMLLQKQRSQEAHIQASMIFTANDVLINLGVIVSALAVSLSGSRWPDLLVGSIVFALVLHGARRILQLARPPAPITCHCNDKNPKNPSK